MSSRNQTTKFKNSDDCYNQSSTKIQEKHEEIPELIQADTMNSEEEMDESFDMQRCTTRRDQYVHTIIDKVLMFMKPSTRFHFVGKLKVFVLYGCVDIFGYNSTMLMEPLEVYSPKSHNFVSIRSVADSDKKVYDLTKVKNYLTKEGINLSKRSLIMKNLKECGKGWSIILLQNFENTLTTFLNKYSQYHLFPTVDYSNSHRENDIPRAEHTLQAHLRLNGDRGKEIVISNKWKNEVALTFVKQDLTRDNRSRFILFGGKGTGKSTTIRYLINQCLQLTQNKKIILIDLDPGQSECTPAGSISLSIIEKPLLGPNFTHTMTPYYEIALGEVSVVQCVTNYMNGVAKIAEVLNNDEKLKGFSVFVNTMGFNKGIGVDIACAIIKIFQPTHVYQIKTSSHSDNFERYLNSNYINKKNLSWISCHLSDDLLDREHLYQFQYVQHYELEFPEVKQFNDDQRMKLQPFQLRELVLLSYLSKITENVQNLCLDKSQLSINDVKPYSVPFSSICVSLTISAVPATRVLDVINGNVVGLCGVDIEQVQNASSIGSEKIRVFSRPPLATCYGYGIIRGFDVENKLIFVTTPLSLNTLKHVNCFMGCTSTPKSLLELNKQDSPYTDGNEILPTSRYSRRGFFRSGNFQPKSS